MTNVYAVAMSPVLSACALHRHDCWEIILNLSGEGIETVGEEEFPFEPGSLTVCPPGVWHTKRCAPGQTWQDMYVSFDAEGFSVSRRRFRDDESGVCRQLIRLLQSACARPGGEACRRALCEALCAQVREWDQCAPIHPLVERILHRMTLDFSDPEFTVGRALEGLGYWEDSLRRLLRPSCGRAAAATRAITGSSASSAACRAPTARSLRRTSGRASAAARRTRESSAWPAGAAVRTATAARMRRSSGHAPAGGAATKGTFAPRAAVRAPRAKWSSGRARAATKGIRADSAPPADVRASRAAAAKSKQRMGDGRWRVRESNQKGRNSWKKKKRAPPTSCAIS